MKPVLIAFSLVSLLLSGCQSQPNLEPQEIRTINITNSIRVPTPIDRDAVTTPTPSSGVSTEKPKDSFSEETSTIEQDRNERYDSDKVIVQEPVESNTFIHFADDIPELQSILNQLGLDVSETGVLDAQTEQALRKFQLNHDLDPTGKLDSKTSKRLNDIVSLRGLNSTRQEATPEASEGLPEVDDTSEHSDIKSTLTVAESPPTEGLWVVVNKSDKSLVLFEGTRAKETFKISIGKKESPTPSGKYEIIVRAINPSWGGMGGKYPPVKGGAIENPLGSRWMGLSVEGTKGTTYGIHGSNRPDTIGSVFSSGCVRMKNSDVEKLYDLLPNGTNVWMGDENTLKTYGIR